MQKFGEKQQKVLRIDVTLCNPSHAISGKKIIHFVTSILEYVRIKLLVPAISRYLG